LPRGARSPKDNADYWRAKIARNRARDVKNLAALEAMGWRAVVVFECALKTRRPCARASRRARFAFLARPPCVGH